MQAGGTTTHRRMLQQLLQTLRSVASVREVDITVNGFTLQVPDGGTAPDSSYLVGNDPVGGLDGRVGVLSDRRRDLDPGIGRAADGARRHGRVDRLARSQPRSRCSAPPGCRSCEPARRPPCLDAAAGLLAPSLDPLRLHLVGAGASPRRLLAIGAGRHAHAVPGLPERRARRLVRRLARRGAGAGRLETAGGPRLHRRRGPARRRPGPDRPGHPARSADRRRDPLVDAAWVDGVTVVALTDGRRLTSVDTYAIGGQHTQPRLARAAASRSSAATARRHPGAR